jgi:phage terminase large subunit
MIQQEFYCSFHGGMQGSYYSRLVERARSDGRIGVFSYIPGKPVHTYWDIGHSDYTVIGLAQRYMGKVVWIDCIYATGEGLPFFASELQRLQKERGYQYGDHNFPHDMAVTDFGSGEQRITVARRLGIRPARIVPKMDLLQGIDAVRRHFPTYCFDESRCRPLISALTNYRKKVDEKSGYFSKKPHHDANSDFADMVRMEATSMAPQEDNLHALYKTAETEGGTIVTG